MVTKTQAPAKKEISKKPVGKQSKKDEDEAYVATKSAKGKQKKGGDEKSDVKRPLSAFFHFCAERRISLKQEDPSMPMGQQTKKMSEEWKNMDAKKKKKYEDLNAKDKERYDREVEQSGGGNKKKKKPAENGEPKRPVNAYFLYQNDRLEQLKKEQPNKSHKECTQILSKEWADLDKAKKDKYEKRAKEGKDQYEVDKKQYQESKSVVANGNGKAIAKKKGGDEPPAKKNGNHAAAPAKKGSQLEKQQPQNKKGKKQESEDEEDDEDDEKKESGEDDEEDGDGDGDGDEEDDEEDEEEEESDS
ncbi:high mobility group protein b2 [Stylonychia lemnae]|uniref:High mobility group protein b2 n=1 Tax=Stylonychia lemnae TaxID=5949 RepID=A0A078AX90_STYLE|nr:high mobility group protein b2 [Stylonychia lemnae]|eukprot:CDW85383.1 high mobility group protein b2 [Stylonychia lemnae]